MLLLGDCLERMKELPDNSVDSMVTDPPYGWSFMGKGWDYDVPKVEVWQECLRVLKPGGHILVACGTRTQHRMAVNIEDAGFEIRDIVAWVYGSGFPKSLNIGKAVDKLQGNEREVVGVSLNDRPDSQVKGGRAFDRAFDEGQGHETINITKGTSPWEGWGTALKPAMELWTLARKPLSEKTVAENVLKWGTGGINIDGCRIGTEKTITHRNGNSGGEKYGIDKRVGQWENPIGRFPANFIHDGSEEVVGMFPDTKPTKPHGGDGRKLDTQNTGWGFKRMPCELSDNGGSASRFFYCAKASKSERDAGLNEFAEKQFVQFQTANGTSGKPSSLSEGRDTKYRNIHPTVKPVSLMRYLCRLITPPKGIVLDPFMGSGSTGIAAKQEGFEFIGIEKEPDYLEIAKARIDSVHIEQKLL